MSYTIIEDNLTRLKTYRDDSRQNLTWSSVFVLPDWMEIWWQVFGSEAELLVRTVQAGEKVIGIAPLMLKNGIAYLIGDTDVCDYHDFIITPGLGRGILSSYSGRPEEKWYPTPGPEASSSGFHSDNQPDRPS